MLPPWSNSILHHSWFWAQCIQVKLFPASDLLALPPPHTTKQDLDPMPRTPEDCAAEAGPDWMFCKQCCRVFAFSSLSVCRQCFCWWILNCFLSAHCLNSSLHWTISSLALGTEWRLCSYLHNPKKQKLLQQCLAVLLSALCLVAFLQDTILPSIFPLQGL